MGRDPEAMGVERRPGPIGGVLFDFDGTLTWPGPLDFNKIRLEINCPQQTPILEYLETLPEPDRSSGVKILERHEALAAADSFPNRGSVELLATLVEHGVPVSLVTRNSRISVDRALVNFPDRTADCFRVIISRDDPLPPKPDPASVIESAGIMGVSLRDLLVVGDYIFDMQAGQRAGALTALVTNGNPAHDCGFQPDLVVTDLLELRDHLLDRTTSIFI